MLYTINLFILLKGSSKRFIKTFFFNLFLEYKGMYRDMFIRRLIYSSQHIIFGIENVIKKIHLI